MSDYCKHGGQYGRKVYKTMKSVGASNIVLGILLIVGAIAAGVVLIAKGAKLLHDKSELTF